jgi:hypothetical protein
MALVSLCRSDADDSTPEDDLHRPIGMNALAQESPERALAQ